MTKSINKTSVWISVLCLMVLGVACKAPADSNLMIDPDNFIIGADVSSMEQYMMGGGRFGRQEQQPEVEPPSEPDWSWIDSLRLGGINYIRLRTFINPEVTNSHERAYSEEGFCDLEHTIEVAHEVKARGMYFLLDFHYSNTWADPAKQWKPVSWEDLHGEELEQKVYDYTRDAIQQLVDANAKPDMVQVGNEVINGMLWPDGKIERYGDYTVFANLMKAGIKAVHDVDPDIKILMHLALGGQNHRSRNFLDKMIAQGVEFDIIGQSYYSNWHGTMSDLRENLVDLAQRYEQDIIVVEYGGGNVRELHDLVRTLPNNKGIGTFVFGGESLAMGNRGFYGQGGREGQQEDRLEVYRQIARDYSEHKEISMDNVGIRKAPPVELLEPIAGANITELDATDQASLKALADQGINMARIDVLFDNTGPQSGVRGFWGRRAVEQEPVEPMTGPGSVQHALALAKQAKNAGMKIMVIMHYSDDYTSLGQQKPPSEWEPNLEDDVQSMLNRYTRGVIARFVEQETATDIVQIGNEISDGILLPLGVVDPEKDFGGLVRVGSAGAREASPTANVMLSMATVGDIEKSLEVLRTATITDVIFDAISMSYDPQRDGSIDNLKNTLNAIVGEYPLPVAVVVEKANILDQVNPVIEDLPNGLGLGTIVSD
ncbi:MAG TPA: glycosyl hydrolase 53 family protein [Draconibacterium sp.]|nr:glycosyl hydrolase 53 family protein [Draconibacterium sp.]